MERRNGGTDAGTDDGRFTRIGCIAGLAIAVLLPMWGFVLYFVSALFG